jgi:hypothetical protein
VSLETLFFLLAVGLFVYANLIRPLRQRRRGTVTELPPSQPDTGGPTPQAPAALEAERFGATRIEVEAATERPRPPRGLGAAHELARPPRASRRRHPGLPSPAELRRLAPADLRGVVVLTTVLGPCRALEASPRDPAQRG